MGGGLSMRASMRVLKSMRVLVVLRAVAVQPPLLAAALRTRTRPEPDTCPTAPTPLAPVQRHGGAVRPWQGGRGWAAQGPQGEQDGEGLGGAEERWSGGLHCTACVRCVVCLGAVGTGAFQLGCRCLQLCLASPPALKEGASSAFLLAAPCSSSFLLAALLTSALFSALASPSRCMTGQGGRPRDLLQAQHAPFLNNTTTNAASHPNLFEQVKEGDRVIYFKYAGDSMETPSGEKFNVLHQSDILAKL